MIKHLLKHLAFILMLLLSLSGGAIWLTHTETGLQSGFLVISKIIPGKLIGTNLHGRLLGPIYMDTFSYANKNLNISAQQIQFAWSFKDLWFNKITIEKFYAQNIVIKKFNSVAKAKTDSVTSWKTIWQQLQLPTKIKFKDIQLHNITYQDPSHPLLHFDSLNLQSSIDGNNITHLTAELQAANATVMVNGSVHPEWNLIWKIHAPKLQQFFVGAVGDVEATGKIIGARQFPQVTAQIAATNFKYQKIAIAKLQSTAAIDLSLLKNSQVTVALQNLQTNTIKCAKMEVAGNIQNVAKQTNITLTLAPTVVRLPTNEIIPVLKIKGVNLHGTLAKIGLVTKTQINLVGLEPISVVLNLPQLHREFANLPQQTITGNITWHTNNLALAQNLLPQFKNLQGTATINYGLSGTLAQPQFIGKLTLQNATCRLPDLNLQLQQIELTANHVGKQITYAGSLHSGDGILHLSGETLLAPKTITHKLNLTANNFLVANTSEYKIIAAAQLTLLGNNQHYTLSGKVFIPTANIQPLNLNGPASLPTEIVLVKKRPEKPTPTVPLDAQLQLTLGDAVNVKVMDLTGKVSGTVQITDTPQKLATAVGNLAIHDGSYNIYGQQLKVTTGSLHFVGGPVTNPEINVQAIREFKATNSLLSMTTFDQTLTVGIRMYGMLDNLHVDLFSIPAGLAKQDIFSYLVLGQPSSQVSENKTQLLMKAATALNVSGSGEITRVVDKFRQQLGLADFGVTAETRRNIPTTIVPSKMDVTSKPGDTLTTNTAFVLGKFLTPKIYVGYSVGLLDPVSIFRVRYYMGRHWSVQSETSALSNGADLFYSIEQD